MYAGEEDRVRWGLIKVLGDLKIAAATRMIVTELKSSYHRECAIEALGKIGAEEAFIPLRDFLSQNPESALIALLPLALTGRQRSLKYLRPYLSHEMATWRQAAIRALSTVETAESLNLLKEHLPKERDDRVHSALNQSIRIVERALSAKEAILQGKAIPAADDQTVQMH
jgi:HEAT repeat protein